MTDLRPVAPRERVAILDILRGLALLGVLIVNVEGVYSSGWFRAEPGATPIDAAANWLIRLGFHGKAMTLLTFLFGLGFAVQLARAEERGEDVRRTYVRRMLVLLGVGLCHIAFWWGDVTSQYAVLGFALLAFRRASPRALLAWAGALIFVPLMVMAIPGVTAAVRTALGQPASEDTIRESIVAAVRGPDYGAAAAAQLRMLPNYFALVIGWFPFWVIGRFLLGYYAGTRRLFDGDGAAHLPLFRRIFGWGALLGALASASVWVVHARVMARYELTAVGEVASAALTEVSVLAMTATYVAAAVLLVQRPAARRVLMIFAPVGRMPLTVYLSQTLVASFVFYGWGLGLSGRAGAAACFGVSVAIYALQVIACHLWLRRYRFGPVDWLWRSLAYGKRQPMRSTTS